MPESYLIRNAKLFSPGHSSHLKQTDLLIEKGIVKKIAKSIDAKAQEISGKALWVTSGLCGLRTHLTDPGYEYKDSIDSLLETAAAGGFTSIVTTPDTKPKIDSKGSISYLINASKDNLVSIMPTGKLTEATSNENLAELYDMHQSGAAVFSNGEEEVTNGLLKKALLYVKPFNGKVFTTPLDFSLGKDGLVNESENTIHTGLKVSPSLAEEISVKEQIEIARYCDASIHLSGITSAGSVELIKQAKKEGVSITCDTTIFNLCFTDNEVLGFDENFKLKPMLRTELDRQALIAGVNSGTIDAISVNHCPQNPESKVVEFNYAAFGALSLQFVLSWYLEHLQKDIRPEIFIQKLTSGPKTVLQIKNSAIEEGSVADMCVFNTEEIWEFNESTNKSKSKNSHLWNKKIKGKTVALFNNKKTKTFN